ncbi:hypothetical protein [Actimicrobium antarcticum]|uniref:Uncharacterized protein n=1 Tax=Actimicrobium antarcticum TaxID=1051899 RepID=A0ABP7TUQ1_9BURK
MNKNFWKQFAIALALFLAGYFTFNSKFLTDKLSGVAESTVTRS